MSWFLGLFLAFFFFIGCNIAQSNSTQTCIAYGSCYSTSQDFTDYETVICQDSHSCTDSTLIYAADLRCEAVNSCSGTTFIPSSTSGNRSQSTSLTCQNSACVSSNYRIDRIFYCSCWSSHGNSSYFYIQNALSKLKSDFQQLETNATSNFVRFKTHFVVNFRFV